MEYKIPRDFRYTETHEWVRENDGTVRIGITDFAQDELGDIVFVELPESGDKLDDGQPFGVVESIKAVSDVHAPTSGRVVETNDDIRDRPELINDDPFGSGWMIELESEQGVDHLLSPSDYEDRI